MNILVIGNGFDLAHGLPTKYGDFLEWIVAQVYYYDYLSEQQSALTQNISRPKLDIPESKFIKRHSQRSIKQHEIWECIDDNVWLEYFLQCNMYQKENWIDFESEISRVIKSFDKDMQDNGIRENTAVTQFTESYFADFFLNNWTLLERGVCLAAEEEIRQLEKSEGRRLNVGQYSEYMSKYQEEHPCEDLKDDITYKQLITRLENDLNRLIRALEIYLAEYVSSITSNNINNTSPDIKMLNPDCVLSFNYSDTYEKLYGNEKQIEYDYIHGKADINNTVETNNMVLGIDEYLKSKRINKETSFIAFKKYYQRIYKGTGCKYKEWIYEIMESAKNEESKLRKDYPIQIAFDKFTNDAKHNLYIFGHSLDTTDKDILRELILHDNVYTKIFCYNKADLGAKIANLVKVIGQDELIRRTGGKTTTIKFELQKDMK